MPLITTVRRYPHAYYVARNPLLARFSWRQSARLDQGSAPGDVFGLTGHFPSQKEVVIIDAGPGLLIYNENLTPV